MRLHPASSPVVPRPHAARAGEPTLRLARVVTASDLNPRYLDCWPLARRAWREVAGIEPLLVLVAAEPDIPEELRHDPAVAPFAPVDGLHTAFQAQCVRLLYPALLPNDGAVLTTDVDMLPLSARYFHEPLAHVPADHFVAYRDVLLELDEIPICYNAALPSTWSELFGIGSLDEVRDTLVRWATSLDYDGLRGGVGWNTDQLVLYRTLLEWALRTQRAWILDDHDTRHSRLDRGELEKPRTLSTRQERRLRTGGYGDFHCLLPQTEFRELNERVVELAVSGAAARASARG